MSVEAFVHRGQNWKRISIEPREQWIVAVDLGCAVDHTAIAVMRHVVEPLDSFKTKRARNGAYSHTITQDAATRYEVPHLERLPLGVSYPNVVEHIAELLARDPIASVNPDLIIDYTGVGAPVCDLLDQRGLNPIKICITSGDGQSNVGNNRWNVSKAFLISGLDAVLNTGELHFAAELLEAGALKNELANFNRSVSSTSRVTYAARTGQHDDLVLAIALAVWRARGNGPGVVHCGTYGGLY
jgi:hypothetical protein